MKTLARRAIGSPVTHHKTNYQRHKRVSRFRVDVSVEIDLDFGRVTKEDSRLKTRCHPVLVRKSSWDYHPPDYKPSWDPDGLCTGCGERLGLKYMPVRVKVGEDIFNPWHYDCLQESIRALEAIEKSEPESESEEVAV